MNKCPRCGKEKRHKGLCQPCASHFANIKKHAEGKYFHGNKHKGFYLRGGSWKVRNRPVTLAKIGGTNGEFQKR